MSDDEEEEIDEGEMSGGEEYAELVSDPLSPSPLFLLFPNWLYHKRLGPMDMRGTSI